MYRYNILTGRNVSDHLFVSVTDSSSVLIEIAKRCHLGEASVRGGVGEVGAVGLGEDAGTV